MKIKNIECSDVARAVVFVPAGLLELENWSGVQMFLESILRERMEFTDEDLEKLSRLCRIPYTEEEKKALMNDLLSVLNYIEQLNEIDPDGVEECHHAVKGVSCPMREDVACDVLDRQTFLDNSPDHVAGMIKVPPILKSQGS